MVKFVYDIKDGSEIVAKCGETELYPVVFNKEERNLLVDWLRFAGEQTMKDTSPDADFDLALINDMLDMLEDKGDFLR
jgi:hypothetical protein